MFYKGLLDLHSLLRWIILILLVINIIRQYAKLRDAIVPLDKKLGLFLMISAHLTLLVGLAQWAWHWLPNIPAGTNIMKNDYWRFYIIEHPVGMIIAIVLITIGKGVLKKDISDIRKRKKMALYYIIALVIILLSIPWPWRMGVGRPLL